jgi:octaprenyl-diphosphate synthase
MAEQNSINGAEAASRLPSRIDNGLLLTERRIDEIIAGSDPIVLRYLENFSANRGKQLRPRLVLLLAELFGGGNLHAIANCSACCELLHIATLIHDDVIDEADTRRGSATLSSRFGNEIAVIVGDYILALVLRALNEERDFALSDMLLATSQELGLGVIEEVVNRGNYGMSVEKYYEVIYLKTAALFSLCCRIGASLGGASPEQVTAAGQYGKLLGLGFQIVDDLLDLMHESAAIGKPTMNDIREGRVTLPLIHAYGLDAEGTRRRVDELLAGSAAAAESELRAHLVGLGSIDFAVKQARHFIDTAHQQGSQLFAAQDRQLLLDELNLVERRVLEALAPAPAGKV